jgi:hypothetical protein
LFERVLGVSLHPFEKQEIENSTVFASVEGVQRAHVFLRQFKVEQVYVGLDPVGVAAFGDDDDVLLDQVAQQDLPGSFSVFFRQFGDDRMAQNVGKILNANSLLISNKTSGKIFNGLSG